MHWNYYNFFFCIHKCFLKSIHMVQYTIAMRWIRTLTINPLFSPYHIHTTKFEKEIWVCEKLTKKKKNKYSIFAQIQIYIVNRKISYNHMKSFRYISISLKCSVNQREMRIVASVPIREKNYYEFENFAVSAFYWIVFGRIEYWMVFEKTKKLGKGCCFISSIRIQIPNWNLNPLPKPNNIQSVSQSISHPKVYKSFLSPLHLKNRVRSKK